MKMKFYKCNICGNIVAIVEDGGGVLTCCGAEMKEIPVNTVEGAGEKHIPVVMKNGNKVVVQIGSEAHPMSDDHFIQWIAIETTGGNQRKCLKPDDKPEACFELCKGDDVTAVYAYCNIHGLWKADA